MSDRLDKLLAEARKKVLAMSPEEYEAMLAAQRASWVRGMAPCEHGVRDWEQCPDCRQPLAEGLAGQEKAAPKDGSK